MTEESSNRKDITRNIICFTNSPWSSAVVDVRLKAPLQACGYNVIKGNDAGNLLVRDLSIADYVVVQRDFPRYADQFFFILKECRKKDIPLIYEIDDLLFDLPRDHPDQKVEYYTNGLPSIYTAISKADLVTTSTEPLAEILRSINSNVKLLPNYLIDSYWKFKSPKEVVESQDKIVIGYIGTGTHFADLEMVQDALKTVAKNHGSQIELKFLGIAPPQKLLPYSQIHWHPEINSYQEFAEYISTENFDIVIAPLVSNQFSDCKSPLKYLEYSALSVPGVYSKVLPYERVVRHGENGFLASSNDEWIYYLEQLIQSSTLRHQIAINAQEMVMRDWMLSQHSKEWAESYDRANTRKNTISGTMEKQESILEKALTRQVSYGEKLRIDTIALNEQIAVLTELANELAAIKSSRSWRIFLRVIAPIRKLFPPNSLQLRIFDLVWKGVRELSRNGLKSFIFKSTPHIRSAIWRFQKRRRLSRRKPVKGYIQIEPVTGPVEIPGRGTSIDIVVCVHNALDDVRRCLDSIEQFTKPPYQLILVDDGSSEPTKNFLQDFSQGNQNCILLRNEEASGYTRAANKGLHLSKADFVILINSDTVVGPEWLDRMYAAITSNDKFGVAGPLSNTASWQSVPKLETSGDWADNPLPAGVTVEEMSRYVAQGSGTLRPEATLLNGFCMMIRRAVIDSIGYLDEEVFGEGYGEEDDFNLRARQAGWKLVIADDVYIYHAQSKSYSHERRHALSQRAGQKLRDKHGFGMISDSVQYMNPNRIMDGIRARSEVQVNRFHFLDRGRSEFAGKKVLFVLPIVDAGGGGNVVIDEARCMQGMGVDVSIFNLTRHKDEFLRSYPHLDIPVRFGGEESLLHLSFSYDAMIATANYSVEWLKPVWEQNRNVKLGYYIQGFEVLMYREGSRDAKKALASYSLIDGMRRFAKTEWVKNTVLIHAGVNIANVGISVNTDLFRPRHARPLGEKPVAIVAMVRPGSPYRNPRLTMEVLRKIERQFGNKVEIRLFGSDDIRDPGLDVPTDFNWAQAGKLTQLQVANLLSDADVFVDFSSHQAMGLTALEAMSCGCTVIVPENGGATEFVQNRENGIVVDTASQEACYNALKLLVENDTLRKNLQLSAMKNIAQYFPEAASYKILKCLFNS